MNIVSDMPTENMPVGANIKVIGVGGGGGNAVKHMIEANLENVSFICANTDLQALSLNPAKIHIQLGKKLTRGLGAGSKPEQGKGAAEESLDDIRNILEGTDMLFITACMGGGTGTGAAPVIAKVAKEKGILTVGVVTKPFKIEGSKRTAVALAGIEDLKQYVDSLVVIPNDKLLAMSSKNTRLIDLIKKSDEVLYDAVRGITDLITKPGFINADFNDVRSAMEFRGLALMGSGRATGENRAMDAVKNALSNPLLDDLSINGCKAMLVNLAAGEDLSMDEFESVLSHVEEMAKDSNGDGPLTKVAMSLDDDCGEEIRVTIIATGLDHDGAKVIKKEEPQAQPTIQRKPRVRDVNDILERANIVTEPTTTEETMLPRNPDTFTITDITDPDDIPAYLKRKH